ncbi:MAG: transposase [Anaerolineae bacterium]|nr:transposase [Anaerolineae bacterium]
MASQDEELVLERGNKTIPSWRSRGYLPHYETPQEPQMLTFRLHDSLPSTVLSRFAEELKHLGPSKIDVERRRRIEAFLDKGAGSCLLSNAAVAHMTEQALEYFDRQRYTLHAWVIMPNHVHVLLTPGKDESLSGIIHSWKSFTAKRANVILGRQGSFWQREYFDRKIRDERHLNDAIVYIHNNPLQAGLCEDPVDWQFSSAHRLTCR